MMASLTQLHELHSESMFLFVGYLGTRAIWYIGFTLFLFHDEDRLGA
jgi:hypothetical protein